MPMIYVKPAPGGRVRQPERQSRVMPEEGAYVPRNAHYERLLATGDVTECDAPARGVAPASTKSKKSSNPPSGGSASASAAPEE